MNDSDFITTLKRKKDSHLSEIRRLTRLVESIDNLMREYSNGTKPLTQTEIPMVSGPPPSTEIDLTGLNLTEAILQVMGLKPSYGWRGAEITKRLRDLGYKLNNLGQKVSARLIERTKSDNARWERLEKKETDKYPKYRLKGALENTQN
ncbi:MAG: hypothetical protein OEV49_07640 [candidate division Zixibacteria bacterium]|nr:hypothetical protein [candidate division Zixibacteria bacterium]MDH3938213.1 hypothetical protein [candidate division Zixibacteria bacterium]MDH4035732.1 hypothetical protein [candidate division Zixibacteria bacterium]